MTKPATYLESSLAKYAGLLTDPKAVEIAINADGQIWIERAGDAGMQIAGFPALTGQDLVEFASNLAGGAGARLGEASPLVSGSVDFRGRKLRLQILAPPAVAQGAAIAIRIFSQTSTRSAAPEYLYGEPVSLDEIRREKMKAVTTLLKSSLPSALEMIVRRKLNVLVSGGTSSGKTTVARHLLSHIGDDERIVTIEDALELFPGQQNVVAMLADRKADSPRNPARLLEAALRLRPDRIVLGEIRGTEALTYIEAINTGHGGSVSTIHAETAVTAIDRLAMMVLQAGTALNFGEVKEYIAQTIDVIIQLGRDDGRRGVTEIVFPGQLMGEVVRLI